jgi:ribonuclease Z
MGADVLVHEATFDDTKGDDAVAKRHCTISEALGVAVRMSARTCVLTHFSQRYPAMPVLPDTLAGRVAVSFDLMSVSFDHISWASESIPTLKELFPPEEVDDDAPRD